MTAKTDPKNQIGMFSDVGPLPSVREALGSIAGIANHKQTRPIKWKSKEKAEEDDRTRKGEGGSPASSV